MPEPKSPHTPGPWIIQPYRRHDKDIFVGPCTVDHDDVDLDQAEADARLIAAAPDLLAGLEAIKSLALPTATHIHSICDNLIAKARGEEEDERGHA